MGIFQVKVYRGGKNVSHTNWSMLTGNYLRKKFSVPSIQPIWENLRKNKLWGKIRRELASEEEKLQYNRLKNQIRRLTRKGKKLLEKKVAQEAKSNPKSFWK